MVAGAFILPNRDQRRRDRGFPGHFVSDTNMTVVGVGIGALVGGALAVGGASRSS